MSCRTARRCRGDSRWGCSGLALGHRAHAPAGEQLGPSRWRATALAFDRSTMPLQRRWPMLEVSDRPGCPRGRGQGRVLAILDPEIPVEPTLEIGGLRLELVGEGRRPSRRAEPGQPPASSRRTHSPGVHRSPAASGSRPSWKAMEFQNPSRPGSRARTSRSAACMRCSRCP